VAADSEKETGEQTIARAGRDGGWFVEGHLLMKPLAIDLFCGLSKPKFLGRTYVAIKKLVAGWAQNPDHMTLRIRGQTPRAVPFELWLVCYLKNARFTTRLAGSWHLWPTARQSVECNIFELSPLLIERPTFFVLARRPLSAKFAGRLVGTLCRTIALVSARRDNRKMYAASSAVPAFFGNAFVLIAMDAPGALCTFVATPFLIGLRGSKGSAT
jgi:hypothetical protein